VAMGVAGNAGNPRPILGSGKFLFRKSRVDSAINRLHFRRNSILNIGIKTFFSISRRVAPLIGPPENVSSVQLSAVIPPHNTPRGALLYFSNKQLGFSCVWETTFQSRALR
jgi:hypothetical protein